MTPLVVKLARRIAETGPLSLHAYMAACLADPEHGYYRARPVIGGSGDFITAPEISQVFGELLGLWSAVVWQQMGSPTSFQLVEIGPGRGTMMVDVLRAAHRVPGFLSAARVVLVEPSPVLRDAQRQSLAPSGVDLRWVVDPAELEGAPTILLANEFLDVIPITQIVRRDDGWHERTVGLDENGALAFGENTAIWHGELPESAAHAPAGAILELRDLTHVARALSRIAAQGPFAALFIDYGHEATGFGDTLQAVRQHRSEHPLASPGEADLTAMVDFEAAAAAFADDWTVVERLMPQAEFLGALGITERASRLMAANPARAAEIEAGVARLIAPNGMGSRFLALGVRSQDMGPLPGFES